MDPQVDAQHFIEPHAAYDLPMLFTTCLLLFLAGNALRPTVFALLGWLLAVPKVATDSSEQPNRDRFTLEVWGFVCRILGVGLALVALSPLCISLCGPDAEEDCLPTSRCAPGVMRSLPPEPELEAAYM